jgi:peroxiredoxin
MAGLWARRLVAGLAAIAFTASVAAQAPRVTLRGLDGRTFDTAQRRGRITVLSFGATWVPKTDKDLAAFQRLADRYAGRGVDFYWVSTNSTRKTGRSYISDDALDNFKSEVGLKLRVLRDPDREAFRAFGLDLLPSIVILDREGQVCLRVVGLDPEETEYYDPQRLDFYTTRAYGDVIRCLNELLR